MHILICLGRRLSEPPQSFAELRCLCSAGMVPVDGGFALPNTRPYTTLRHSGVASVMTKAKAADDTRGPGRHELQRTLDGLSRRRRSPEEGGRWEVKRRRPWEESWRRQSQGSWLEGGELLSWPRPLDRLLRQFVNPYVNSHCPMYDL